MSSLVRGTRGHRGTLLDDAHGCFRFCRDTIVLKATQRADNPLCYRNMAKIQLLRVFLSERLTAVAEEIFGVVEKTVSEYQDEVFRLQRLLDIVLQPEMKDLQQLNLSVSEAELPTEQQHSELEWSPSHRQESTEPTQIKKELDELRSSQDEEQLQWLEKNDSDFSPAFVQSHHNEDPTQCSYNYEAQKEGKYVRDIEPRTTTEQIKTEPTGEDCSESEPTSVPHQLPGNNPECSSAHSEIGDVDAMENGDLLHFNQVKSKRTMVVNGQDSGMNTTSWKPTQSNPPSQISGTSCCCKVCGKSFHCMGSLFKHVQTHTQEKQVGVCDKTFRPATSMKAPIPIRTAARFCCHVCGQWFGKKSTLLFHLKSHTGEKYLSCPVCRTCFKQSGNLKRHMMIHTGEKPYRCCHCGKGFNQSGSLTSHMRSHTGEKPFQCTDCGRGFSNSSNLTKHIRIHTGERPFCCPQCGKSFTRSGHLKNHMMTHTAEK